MATRKPKTSPSQANTYIQALESERARLDRTQEQNDVRDMMSRMEKLAQSMAATVKNQHPQNYPGSPKTVEAIKKMLEDTLESMIPNTKAAYDAAKKSLEATEDAIKNAVELTDQEREFLRSFNQQVSNEINQRSTAWTRGMTALRKSFTGLDSDMKSLIVGATTKSPILMIATKLLLRTKEEKKDLEIETMKAGLDRKIELAKARAEAEAAMNLWVAQQQQKSQTTAPTAPHTQAPKTPRQPRQTASQQPSTTTPQQQAPANTLPPAAPVPAGAVLLSPDEVSDRDRARDLAIEMWLAKNPGKELDDSPFARQDKVWAQPRREDVSEVQVTDEPVKEAVEALTTVVAGQTEPIRESLHQDEETNDLLHRVLASGEQLAEDMEMRDEERERETKPTAVSGGATVQQVVAAASKTDGKGGGLFSSLLGFSLTDILGALGFTGLIGSMKGLSKGLPNILRGLGRGLLTASGAVVRFALGATRIAAAFGIGWLIGEGLEKLAKQFLGFSLKDAVSGWIQRAVAKMVTDKEERMRSNITEANRKRTEEARSKRRTGDIELPNETRTTVAEPKREPYPPTNNLPITGVFSGSGQYHTADSGGRNVGQMEYAAGVPMHASSPQVVAQGAIGNGTLKTASQWTMSPAGLAALKRREGFNNGIPYKDGRSGRWAVGYGFQEWKGRRVEDWMRDNPNFRVTQEEADAELVRVVNGRFRNIVQKEIGNVPLTQTQFDALASVAFNAGQIPNNIERKIKNGEALTRADFERTGTERVVQNGKFVASVPNAALMKRRGGEFDQFSTPSTVATIAPRVAMTGQLAQNSTNRNQPPVVISAPIVAPQTHVASGQTQQPTVMIMPTARNEEPSLNALTRLQTGG